MELRDYVAVLARRWIGLMVITVVVFAGVAAFTYSQPKQYTATAQTFIAVSSPSSDGTVTPDATYTLQRIQSYLRIIDSPQVLQPVIDKLGLEVNVDQLGERVSASNPLDTVILEISATNESPDTAAAVANAVAVQLVSVIQQLETNAAGTVVPVKASITRAAEPPLSPSSPRTRINLLLGFVIGLALGVGYAFLRESMDSSVQSPNDVEQITGSTALGTIAFDTKAKAEPLVTLDQSSVRAEAFRAIRTNLQYVDVDNPPRVIAITSALQSEGKSTSALNLAITMAQAGQRVVLLETDLRRPKTGQYLGIETAVGLTDVLTGSLPLDDALLSWNRGMLTVLAAGGVPPNPSELLASQRFVTVLAELRARYDMVIVDATPLLPVTDGAIVAHVCDGAVLIVRHGKTTREQVAHALDALQRVDARLLGFVINFLPLKRRGYGGYGYGYGYGYYGYRADEGKRRRGRFRRSADAASEGGSTVPSATGNPSPPPPGAEAVPLPPPPGVATADVATASGTGSDSVRT